MADSGRSRSLNQLVGLVAGAAFLLAGLAGFLVTDEFVGQEGDLLLGLQVNGLHNVVHLLIGIVLLVGATSLKTARAANLVIGIAYLALAAVGPFLTGTEANIIALNVADHGLHLVSGVVLTAVAVLADKRSRQRV